MRCGSPRDALAARLRALGCVFAEDEADLVLASGLDPDAVVARRRAGEPLEQILGWTDFAGIRVRLRPGVFVPRQRSARLVDAAVAACPSGGLVVDLCCGSGALAAALLERRPDVRVLAADVDVEAVACARLNLPAQSVHQGDLFDALPATERGGVDVLLAHAPYVPTDEIATMPVEARDHEHRVALDGGPDGLDVVRRVLAGAAQWLAPGGTVLMEVADTQTSAVETADRGAGLTVTVVDGVVTAQRPATQSA